MDIASDLLEMANEYVDSTSYFDEEDGEIVTRFLDLIKLCGTLDENNLTSYSRTLNTSNLNIRNLIKNLKKNSFTRNLTTNNVILSTENENNFTKTSSEGNLTANSNKSNLSTNSNENNLTTALNENDLTNSNERSVTTNSNRRKRSCWVKRWRYSRKSEGAYDSVVKEIKIWNNTFYRNDLLVSEQNFNTILHLIEGRLRRQSTVLREAISPQEQLAVTLRYLATGETHRMLESQTKLSLSYLTDCIPRVCEAIWLNMKDLYLKLPQTEAEWTKISEEFETKWQFPLCVGALGEKHINYYASSIKTAQNQKYKKVVAANNVVLLALTDANSRFLHVDISSNEISNESDPIGQSTLQNILDDSQIFLPQDKVIGNGRLLPHVVVADNAFPLSTHVMKPYTHQTNFEELIYNKRLSRAKKAFDRAFEALAKRFKIFLKRIELRKVAKVVEVTRACCVLHNFFEADGECPDYGAKEEGQAVDFYNYIQTIRTPEEVRMEFMAFFNQEGWIDTYQNE